MPDLAEIEKYDDIVFNCVACDTKVAATIENREDAPPLLLINCPHGGTRCVGRVERRAH
jgi:hypothetical protein